MLIGYIFNIGKTKEGLATYWFNKDRKQVSVSVKVVTKKKRHLDAFNIEGLSEAFENVSDATPNLVDIDSFVENSNDFREEGLEVFTIYKSIKDKKTRDKVKNVKSIEDYEKMVISLDDEDHRELKRLGKSLAKMSINLDESYIEDSL